LDDPARREALPKYCFSISFTIGLGRHNPAKQNQSSPAFAGRTGSAPQDVRVDWGVYRDHGALTELAIGVGPRVRIRLAPAASLRTIGPAVGDGSFYLVHSTPSSRQSVSLLNSVPTRNGSGVSMTGAPRSAVGNWRSCYSCSVSDRRRSVLATRRPKGTSWQAFRGLPMIPRFSGKSFPCCTTGLGHIQGDSAQREAGIIGTGIFVRPANRFSLAV
jgi:hypothetical protein